MLNKYKHDEYAKQAKHIVLGLVSILLFGWLAPALADSPMAEMPCRKQHEWTSQEDIALASGLDIANPAIFEEKMMAMDIRLSQASVLMKMEKLSCFIALRKYIDAVTDSPIRVRGNLLIVLPNGDQLSRQVDSMVKGELPLFQATALNFKKTIQEKIQNENLTSDEKKALLKMQDAFLKRHEDFVSGFTVKDVLTNTMKGLMQSVFLIVQAGKIFDHVDVVRVEDVEAYAGGRYDYKLLVPFIVQKRGIFLVKANRPQVQIEIQTIPSENPGNALNQAIAEAAQQLAESDTTPSRQAPTAQPSAQSYGSAFFVNDKSMAVTNAHVVRNCSTAKARLRNGELFPLSVLAMDRENDLALVKVATRNPDFARLRVGQPNVRQGESVVAYGYPLPGALAAQGVFTTGTVNALSGLFDNTRELQMSVPVQPGNSGGPLLDQSGNVVGVVTRKIDALAVAKKIGDIPQNVNFSIKASIVSSFLEANSVDFSTKISEKPLSNEDVGDKAKSFTFRVECQ